VGIKVEVRSKKEEVRKLKQEEKKAFNADKI
jgi:hypothetical protein